LPAPSSTFHTNPEMIPPFPIARGRPWATHLPGGLPPCHRLTCCCCFYVYLFAFLGIFLLFSSLPVYPRFGVWVLVTHYTCQITFIGDPGFVASVLRVQGSTSSKALPPLTYILSLNFELPRLCCVCFFICRCNLFLYP
jgi:hypothetical protein